MEPESTIIIFESDWFNWNHEKVVAPTMKATSDNDEIPDNKSFFDILAIEILHMYIL